MKIGEQANNKGIFKCMIDMGVLVRDNQLGIFVWLKIETFGDCFWVSFQFFGKIEPKLLTKSIYNYKFLKSTQH
jgi:hypothetical protein